MSQSTCRARRPAGRSLALALILVATGTVLGTPRAGAGLGELDGSFGTGGTVTLPLPPKTADIVHRVRNHLNVGAAGTDMVVVAHDGVARSGTDQWRGPAVVAFGTPSVGYDLAFPTYENREQIVAVGAAGDDFALAAFDPDSSPLRSFGDGGRVTTSFGGRSEARAAVHIGADVLAFGTAEVAGASAVAVARYSGLGALVPAYGQAGKATYDLTPGRDAALVAFRTYEAIHVAGQAGSAAFVARFRPDGTPDPTFGNGGFTILDLSPGEDAITGLAVTQTDVYFAGWAGDDAVVGHLAGAQLDPAFGTGGVVRTRLGGARATFADLVRHDRQSLLVAAGTVTQAGGATDAALFRIDPAGVPAVGFGTGGALVVDLGTATDRGAGVLAVADPSGGTPTPPVTFDLVATDGADMLLLRRASDGQPKEAAIRIEVAQQPEHASRSAVQPDGRIVVTGSTGHLLFLARLLPGGGIDPAFRSGGRAVRELGAFTPLDVHLTGDGKIVVLGWRDFDEFVARFLPGGQLDPSFGTKGVATLPWSQLQQRGRLFPLLGGSFLASRRLSIVTPDGQVTAQAPYQTGPVGESTMDAAGGVVFAASGLSTEGISTRRWRTDGQLDGSYYQGSTGTGFVSAIAALPDGRTIVAGQTTAQASPPLTDGLLQVITADGHLDQSFGKAGVARLDVGPNDGIADLAVQPDGRILTVGYLVTAGAESRLVVSRHLPNGALDRSFANDGVLTSSRLTQRTSALLQPDGRLLVTGVSEAGTARIVRINTAAPISRPVRASGWSGFGQLGDGTLTDRPAGVNVAGLPNASAVAAGANHSLAARSDGTVVAWGWNLTSQLGDGTATDRPAPVPVAGLTGVTAVAAGYLHSLALRADGTVWAWGWNGYGQLGDGTTSLRPTAQVVPGLTGVVAIAAGAYHSMAMRGDGTVVVWGWNGLGQLGDYSLDDKHRPVQLNLGSRARAIAAGAYHGLILFEQGHIWQLGFNALAPFGQPYTAVRGPASVFGLPGPAVALAAGGLHSLAVLGDGSVWSWGWNGYGQVGDGSTAERFEAVRVPGVTNATTVAGGGYHSFALLRDGSVRAWGWNALGQLGDGTTVDRHLPVTVPAARDGRALTAGIVHSLIV